MSTLNVSALNLTEMELLAMDELAKKLKSQLKELGDSDTSKQDTPATASLEDSLHLSVIQEISQFFINNKIEDPNSQTISQPNHEGDSTSPQLCAVCESPASTCCASCSKISISNYDFKKTFYCSKACQTTNWPQHKISCKQIRSCIDQTMLHRAANLLQNAFYTLRKSIFDVSIHNIKVKKNHVTIKEGIYIPTEALIEFPEALVKDKELFLRPMLYSLLACTDQMFGLYRLCDAALQDTGIIKEIAEIHFRPKPGPYTWSFHRPDGVLASTYYDHCAYQITMKNGTQYALDLAGAQFGFTKHLMLWNEYLKERVQCVKQVAPFGTVKGRRMMEVHEVENIKVSVLDVEGVRMKVQEVTNKLADDFTNGFNSELKKSGWDIKKLLTGRDQEQCQSKASHALYHAWTVVHQRKIHAEKNGGFLKSAFGVPERGIPRTETYAPGIRHRVNRAGVHEFFI